MTGVLLLLAGTAEAREFAARFDHPRLQVVASLAGVTSAPLDYVCETRVGGFGSVDGMAAWIAENDVAAVVDATHPFAVRISENARASAARCEVPCLGLRRAPWALGEAWRTFSDLEALAPVLPAGARVFLTTGRGEVEPFARRQDVSFWLRSIEGVEDLPAHIQPVRGRPPFALENEIAFMKDAKITHLVTKDAGGVRPAKLEAAEQLGVAVFSAAMPPSPHDETVDSVDAALAWSRAI